MPFKQFAFEQPKPLSQGWEFSLDRRRDRYHDPHVGICFYPVRFADVRYQDVTGFCRHGDLVVGQELAFPFDHMDTDLSFQVVGMHGKNPSGGNVEVNDLEKFRIMKNKVLHPQGIELPGFVQFNFFHRMDLLVSICTVLLYYIAKSEECEKVKWVAHKVTGD